MEAKTRHMSLTKHEWQRQARGFTNDQGVTYGLSGSPGPCSPSRGRTTGAQGGGKRFRFPPGELQGRLSCSVIGALGVLRGKASQSIQSSGGLGYEQTSSRGAFTAYWRTGMALRRGICLKLVKVAPPEGVELISSRAHVLSFCGRLPQFQFGPGDGLIRQLTVRDEPARP